MNKNIASILLTAGSLQSLMRKPGCRRKVLSIFLVGACLMSGLFGFGSGVAGTVGAASMTSPDEFVRTEGTHFVLKGKRFNVAGVNNHYLTFGSRVEVTRVLDDAAAMGANVIRIFIQPVIGSLDKHSIHTIWDRHKKTNSNDLGVHGTYILFWNDKAGQMGINDGPDGLQKLDWLLAEADKRHLKLIIAFLDFWDYTGGIQQMRAWYGSTDKNTFFFSDSRSLADYRRFVTHVVTRTNVITGRLYRDDSAIFAWELTNEADIKPHDLMRRWIADMSTYVKSIDKNHLVASGLANQGVGLSDIDITSLDFATWHGYPKYLGITPDAFTQKLNDYCAVAEKHGKPVLLEEFGLASSAGDQAAVYESWLETMASNPNCAGWLIWRLVSKQDDGRYPTDEYDQFDVHNDSGATWNVLRNAAVAATRDPPP